MSVFTTEDNACGHALVHIVARGSAIIAELLRLANNIPVVFRLDNPIDVERYSSLLVDFSYFTSVDAFNEKLERNSDLQDRDEEFKESHITLLKRFYKVFESVYKYITDINRFLEELDEGIYIQQSLESVSMDTIGKQLLCESLYLYGVMLLVIDNKYNGAVRERILVAYHRYNANKASVDSHIDDVCKLLRSTGITPTRRPPNYPADYFARVPIRQDFVNITIGRLRSDDVYNQMSNYPQPEHRSVALSTQASLTVNLVQEWEHFKAARTALLNTFENVRPIAQKHVSAVPKLCEKALKLLQEGVLVEEYVLDHIPRLMTFLRECNASLRWVMLHTSAPPLNKKCKQLHDLVMAQNVQLSEVIALLLNTSQLELLLKDMFKALLDNKHAKWHSCQKETSDRLLELADVFSGTKPLARVEKNDNLQAWFREIAKQTSDIDYNDHTTAGRKIAQLIQAIEEVQEFHQLENNWQIRQFLQDTRSYLHQMIRTINVKEGVLIQIQIIGDLSYAWNIIDNYTKYMQNGIKKDPSLVRKLRATFLKLASALDLPLVRICEAGTDDLKSVSECYSKELVSYVRKVLQIIPQSMFSLLEEIIKVLTNDMVEVPTRLDKDKLKDYAQLNERYKVAKLTHAVSVFTDGMLMMKSTLVGVIKVDPKKLLEDGVRKELVTRVAEAFHEGLIFSRGKGGGDLREKLQALSAKTDGFRRSFEYIQDYLNIFGLKIWQEEVMRIVNYNVEQESNTFLRQKVYDWQSYYQSPNIPIPRFQPTDTESRTFIGRLAREILSITNPTQTVYMDPMKAWYDMRSNDEVLNSDIFTKIVDALEPFGLQGLDRLYSFMLVTELQQFTKAVTNLLLSDKVLTTQLTSLMKALHPHNKVVQMPGKVYSPVIAKFTKFCSSLTPFILSIGQLQVIRDLISLTLHSLTRFQSKQLVRAVETLNTALVSNVTSHYSLETVTPTESLFEITPYLASCGFTEPYLQVYNTFKDIPMLPALLFVHLQTHINKLTYNPGCDGLVLGRKTSEPLDITIFNIGLVTVLRQFPREYLLEYLELSGQYINSLAKSPSPPQQPQLTVHLLKQFTRYSRTTVASVKSCLSECTVDTFLPRNT